MIKTALSPELLERASNAALKDARHLIREEMAIVKLKKELELGDKKKKEKRGRKKTNVSLGKVKPNVVKLIVDALVSSNVLEAGMVKQINEICEKSQWNKTDSAEKGFKKIMMLLDQGA